MIARSKVVLPAPLRPTIASRLPAVNSVLDLAQHRDADDFGADFFYRQHVILRSRS